MLDKPYQVLNEITISKEALLSNYRYYASQNPQASLAPVLKANAYGHGLLGIAELVDTKLRAPLICVDSLYEAYELHKIHVKTPILIMGYTDPANYSIWKKLPFSFTVFDTTTLRALNKYQPGAKIHIKLDTGMCRLGLQLSDIPDFIDTLNSCKDLIVEGVYSHFSQADNPRKTTFTNRQIAKFKLMTKLFEDAGQAFQWKHISATAGASFLRDPAFNLVRLGLGFYGYTPFGPHTKEGRAARKKLRPALELSSCIAQIKDIPVGSEIGYGGTYKAKQKERIAILPIGYNEGVPRRLSNLGSVLIGKSVYGQIVGNVSMDMTTIRLPRNHQVKLGDRVTIISRDPKSANCLTHNAQIIKDIEYTLLTGLHPSIRRRII